MCVGKTNLFTRFLKNENVCRTTIGIDFDIRNIEVDGKTVKGHIIDTSGCDRYLSISHQYYKAAAGVMLVYDITDYETYKNIKVWLKDLQDHAKQNIVKMLVGNKSDLQDLRAVPADEAQTFAERNNMSFIETSTLETLNVVAAFQKIFTEIYHNVTSQKGIRNDANKVPSVATSNSNVAIPNLPTNSHDKSKLAHLKEMMIGPVGDISLSSGGVHWKIPNFYDLPQKCDTAISSPRFNFAGEIWMLFAYPNGLAELSSLGWFGIGAYSIPRDVILNILFGIIGQPQINVIKSYGEYIMDGFYRCTKLLQTSFLKSRKDYFVPGGNLHVFFGIEKENTHFVENDIFMPVGEQNAVNVDSKIACCPYTFVEVSTQTEKEFVGEAIVKVCEEDSILAA